MAKKNDGASAPNREAASNKISEIASHYLGQVGGANGTFYEFMQYHQQAGQTGGPAEPGGSFWQEVVRMRPLEVEGGI
jgi:hypothetical protein